MLPIDGRQLGRFVLVSAVLLGGTVLTLVVSFLPGARRRRAFAERGVSLVSRGVLRALDVAVVQRGPTPRGDASISLAGPRRAAVPGALILANHLSWLDIVAALASWRCTFVAKREVGTWPIIGTLARAMGVVFVDRTRKRDLLRSIPALEEALRAGECVMLFPEGTTTHGTHVLRFRSALVEAAVRADAPVFPLAIGGGLEARDTLERPPAVCWCDEETLTSNVWRLAGARSAFLSLHVGAPVAAQGDRKACTRRAFDEVMRRFVPVVDGGRITAPRTRRIPLAWGVQTPVPRAQIGYRA